MGGQMKVESKLGQGTKFTFSVQAEEAESQSSPSQKDITPGLYGEITPASRERLSKSELTPVSRKPRPQTE